MSPLQNRVRPDGELVAVPERGTMMGNRGGRIHDLETRTLGRRRWASRAWICCVLQYQDWYAEPWTDHYTELFFLDEVTALAAGHRPCYLCRRTDAVAFAAAVAAGAGLATPPRAPELDRRLHAERLDGTSKRRHRERWPSLPDGSVVEVDGGFAALRGDELLPWSFAGYGPPAPRPGSGAASVLTPPTVLAALRAGYRPGWHVSAGRGRAG